MNAFWHFLPVETKLTFNIKSAKGSVSVWNQLNIFMGEKGELPGYLVPLVEGKGRCKFKSS
jgi:hypothetical protein